MLTPVVFAKVVLIWARMFSRLVVMALLVDGSGLDHEDASQLSIVNHHWLSNSVVNLVDGVWCLQPSVKGILT